MHLLDELFRNYKLPDTKSNIVSKNLLCTEKEIEVGSKEARMAFMSSFCSNKLLQFNSYIVEHNFGMFVILAKQKAFWSHHQNENSYFSST